jgi:hypothetical protein
MIPIMQGIGNPAWRHNAECIRNPLVLLTRTCANMDFVCGGGGGRGFIVGRCAFSIPWDVLVSRFNFIQLRAYIKVDLEVIEL